MKYAFTLTPAQQTLVEQNMKLIKRTISSSIGTNEGVCGLIAVGNGETDFDAPYDLVSSLYVTPISESISLRLVTFLKLMRYSMAESCGSLLISSRFSIPRQALFP